ncbi:hypothetical protein AVEN_206212-1 [Araneus ventricosus]|uniref:Uncharacterized protein n=1 Tax=Araneus ventricosus TaxID=182803 RepID=A0A4Y2G769_ARAVE|nr:hypothetical protein AVEN_206212-1 [Araneus ventricosus]
MDCIQQSAALNTMVGPRQSSTILPKAEVAPKEDHGDGLALISRSDTFQLPETIAAEKYYQEIVEMNSKLQHMLSVLVSRKGPILLHNNA